MAIAFHCKCGKGYSVPAAMAGRYAKCRRCGTRILIPGQVAETMDLPPPAVIGPFGFIAFLMSLGSIVCALLLPWLAVNLIIQVAVILFASILLLVAGYYGNGYMLPILSIMVAFAAFMLALVVPDGLEKLVKFRNELKEGKTEERKEEKPKETKPGTPPGSEPSRPGRSTQTGP